MDWLRQAGGLLDKYADADEDADWETAGEDLENVARTAPKPALAEGLAQMLRSGSTVPFARIVEQVYGGANSQQRAGLLNILIGAIGPALSGQLLGERGLPALGALFSQGKSEVTPEEADQVPGEAVRELAEQAEGQSPSVIERVGGFLADHVGLAKGLDSSAVTAALAHIARQRG